MITIEQLDELRTKANEARDRYLRLKTDSGVPFAIYSEREVEAAHRNYLAATEAAEKGALEWIRQDCKEPGTCEKGCGHDAHVGRCRGHCSHGNLCRCKEQVYTIPSVPQAYRTILGVDFGRSDGDKTAVVEGIQEADGSITTTDAKTLESEPRWRNELDKVLQNVKPPEHAWFNFHGIPCCGRCGIVRPRDPNYPLKPCPGTVKIRLR